MCLQSKEPLRKVQIYGQGNKLVLFGHGVITYLHGLADPCPSALPLTGFFFVLFSHACTLLQLFIFHLKLLAGTARNWPGSQELKKVINCF